MTVVNTAVYDTFVLRDNVNAAITGKTAADFAALEAYLVSTPVTTAVVTLAEIGSGEYSTAFTPTAVGVWTLHVVYDSGGVFREFSATYDVEAAASVAPITPAPVTTGVTLQNLRRRVGLRLGDTTVCTADADGDASTFFDTKKLKLPDDDYASYSAYVASGDALNVGEERTVTGSIQGTGSLSVSPAYPAALLTGTVLELHNERGTGWTGAEKNAAINQAIADAAGLGGVELTVTPVAAFSQQTPTIAVPDTMTRLFLVEYQDTLGNWIVLPKAGRPGGQGWWVHAAGGTIDISGRWRYAADRMAVRLRGFGQFAELTEETDTTTVNPLYVIPAACLSLLEGGLDRDPARQGLIPLFQREADRWRVAATRVAPPNTTPVRGT